MIFIDLETSKALSHVAAEALAPLVTRADLHVSPLVASALTGRSAASIRAAVDTGSLCAIGRVHRYIAAPALAEWAGIEFTAARWAGALGQINRRVGGPRPVQENVSARPAAA